MRAKYFSLFLLLVFFLLNNSFAALPNEINNQPISSLAPLVKQVAPAVVNIRVSQTVTRRSPYNDEMFRRFFGMPNNPVAYLPRR